MSGKKDTIFHCVWQEAWQAMSFVQALRFFFFPVFPGIWDFLFFRILPYLFIDILVYLLLIRRYEGQRELRERDIRMILLAQFLGWGSGGSFWAVYVGGLITGLLPPLLYLMGSYLPIAALDLEEEPDEEIIEKQ